ncbi:hypothetical protein YPPY89_2625 [Yersinia pestis PY-89]|nr:hypothetical protein YPPY89_2625 [Yersinia pestis PY-89]
MHGETLRIGGGLIIITEDTLYRHSFWQPSSFQATTFNSVFADNRFAIKAQ